MKIHYLDSSIVIPLMATVIGTRAQRRDPQNIKAAHFVLKTKVKMKISVATYAETIRHFPNSDAAKVMLEYFDAPLPLNERHARRWARLQYRSERVMGDNDAWNAALAVAENGVVVGHDEEAFNDRPDVEYIDYMKA
jgi:predicted nucleic acid-binding protein